MLEQRDSTDSAKGHRVNAGPCQKQGQGGVYRSQDRGRTHLSTPVPASAPTNRRHRRGLLPNSSFIPSGQRSPTQAVIRVQGLSLPGSITRFHGPYCGSVWVHPTGFARSIWCWLSVWKQQPARDFGTVCQRLTQHSRPTQERRDQHH